MTGLLPDAGASTAVVEPSLLPTDNPMSLVSDLLSDDAGPLAPVTGLPTGDGSLLKVVGDLTVGSDGLVTKVLGGGMMTAQDGEPGGLLGGGPLKPVTDIVSGITGDDSEDGGLLAPVTGITDGILGSEGDEESLLSPVNSLLAGLGG